MADIYDEGVYEATITEHGLMRFPEKDGKPEMEKYGIVFKFNSGKYIGRTITWSCSQKGRGQQFLEKTLKSCGWDGASDPRKAPIVGKTMRITVKHDAYKNPATDVTTVTANIAFINGLDEEPPESFFSKFKVNDASGDAWAASFVATAKANAAASAGASGGAPKDVDTAGSGAGKEAPVKLPF